MIKEKVDYLIFNNELKIFFYLTIFFFTLSPIVDIFIIILFPKTIFEIRKYEL